VPSLNHEVKTSGDDTLNVYVSFVQPGPSTDADLVVAFGRDDIYTPGGNVLVYTGLNLTAASVSTTLFPYQSNASKYLQNVNGKWFFHGAEVRQFLELANFTFEVRSHSVTVTKKPSPASTTPTGS
jgi:hypothetical protein